MLRLSSFVTAGFLMAAIPGSVAFALTASDCAKLSDPKKKDDCVRSLSTAGKSGTQPAEPANPRGSGPATPAVPGKSKGR
jgi:hypothetical protein